MFAYKSSFKVITTDSLQACCNHRFVKLMMMMMMMRFKKTLHIPVARKLPSRRSLFTKKASPFSMFFGRGLCCQAG